MPKIELYLGLFFLSFLSLSVGYTLHKCCPYHQQLRNDLQTCEDFSPETFYNNTSNDTQYLNVSQPHLINSTNLPWWFFEDVDILDVDTLKPVNPRTSFLQGRFPLDVKAGENLPCSFHSTRLITNHDDFNFLEDGTLVLYNGDTNQSFPSLSYCSDIVQLLERAHVIKLCPCLTKFCIRKCCSPNKIMKVGNFDENSRCVTPENNVTEQWKPDIIRTDNSTLDEPHIIIYGLPKCENSTQLLNKNNGQPAYSVNVLNNCDVRIDKSGVDERNIKYTEYCADITEYEDGTRTRNIVYCADEPVEEKPNNYGLFYGIFVIIGAIFLSATLVVYAVLPELRNLHGSNLMAHTASFLVGYIALAAAHLNPYMPYNLCVAIGFIIQFTVLAAFFWLNVMCIDISWTFSGLRPPQGSARVRDHKKFIYYSCYAWGSSAVISVITAIVQFTTGDHPWSPGFGKKSCLFNGHIPSMVYFYIPMALLLITNLGLFLYTAVKILAVKRQTAFLHKPGSAAYNSDKQRLVLYLKLFLLMGVTWVTEIISFVVGGPHEYWYLTDTINLLRAVLIFILFCCKRSVFQLFKRRYQHSLRGWSVTQKEEDVSRRNRSSSRPSQDNAMSTQYIQPITTISQDIEINL